MIEIKNMSFGYTKSRQIFKDLNLTLASGHIYGLLGKNGAGKTTLLKQITGLLFPKEGTVTVDGTDAAARSAETLGDIYFLQEEMYTPHLRITDFEKAYAPFYEHFDHDKFSEYLQEFEVEDGRAYIDRLSHGQKKKVLIAFAIASNTKILIMDEPTNGLDIPSKSVFRKLMAAGIDDSRLVIISTHQVRDLHSLIDTATILEKGKIILNASAAEITDRLLFDADNTKSDSDEILYEEETPRGTYQVKKNSKHLDSNLDLELLFNAAISNREEFYNIFK